MYDVYMCVMCIYVCLYVVCNSSIILLFYFSFVFNYYLQRTIKFNLIFKRYTRRMYSGTVSLEYHADVTISFFCFPVFPSHHLSFPDRDNGRIPLFLTFPWANREYFSRFCALSSFQDSSTDFFFFFYVLPLFVPREFFRMFLYIIIYSNVKNHGPLNRT